MSRLTEYTENLERSFDDFEKEGMSLDAFLAKTKVVFHGWKLTFSSKSKFALGEKSSVAHEYTLKHKCSRGTSEFKHVATGLTSLELDWSVHRQGDVEVAALGKFELTQGQDKRTSNGNVSVRVHHRNNALLSVGVEKWNFLGCPCPQLWSAYGSYGHVVDGTRLTFNGLVNWSCETKFAPLVRLLVKGTRGDFTGLLVTNVNRTLNENTEDSTKTVVDNKVDVAFRFNNVIDSKTKVGGTISHDVASKTTNATFAAVHVMDKVKVNAKIWTDRQLTVGLTSSFDDVTLNFAANTTLNTVTETEGEKSSTRNWLSYKFGLSAEFNRV